jgi:ABC-2 type transport system ATP-binding protein
MRQKMNFVRGFMTDPEILFLDEPTLGLDVQTARVLRDYVRTWVDERPGRTILLTTHTMHEADELCDRVAIIDRGRILACDTPSRLKRELRKEEIFRLHIGSLSDVEPLLEGAGGVSQFTQTHREEGLEADVILDDDDALLAITAGSAFGLAVPAFLVYRLAERRARRLGLIDMQAMY